MTAALKAAVDRKEPIVVDALGATWMSQKFDVKFLKDPKHVFPPPRAITGSAKGLLGGEPAMRVKFWRASTSRSTESRAINAAVSDGKTMDQAIEDWIDSQRGPI